MAQPRQGFSSVVAGEFGTEEEAQGGEQRRHHKTQGAGVIRVGSGVNDLKRVQHRMADLHTQHCKAEEDEQSPGPARDAAFRPGQSWLPIRRAVQSHDLSLVTACEPA